MGLPEVIMKIAFSTSHLAGLSACQMSIFN